PQRRLEREALRGPGDLVQRPHALGCLTFRRERGAQRLAELRRALVETRVLDGDGELRRQRRQKRDVVRAELPAPWVGDEQPDRVAADPQRDADRTRAAWHVDPDDIAGPERAERELEDILGEGSVPFGDLPARRQRQL